MKSGSRAAKFHASDSLTASSDVIQTGGSLSMSTKPHSATSQRVIWSMVAAGSLVILALAALLEPDARGYGTHTQLGLPPCGLRALTGALCPGCGLTTAFAHAVRGEWLMAANANPLGLVLFLVVCASIPVGITAAVRDWSVDAVIERAGAHRWALGVAGCAIAVWAFRLVTPL